MQLISLVGLPGGGKSTVGRHLARRLNWAFTDTDTLIEQRLGEPIKAYFEREGEERFRDVEQDVITGLPDTDPRVVATGGGAVLRPANRRFLREASVVVYLRSTPEELFRRLRFDTHRPLLQTRDPLQRLRDLHRQREPLYRQVAHYTVDTGRPSVPTLVNMILMQLELAGEIDPSAAPSPVDGAPTSPLNSRG